MKLLTGIIALIFALSMNLKAESDTLLINMKDGKVEKFAITQIQKIKFENITKVEDQILKPQNLSVTGNFPNPFTDKTEIEFETKDFGSVEIVIFDNSGKQIQNLECLNCTAGKNTLIWNCLDKNNNRVQNGTYFYEVRFGKEVLLRKMILVK